MKYSPELCGSIVELTEDVTICWFDVTGPAGYAGKKDHKLKKGLRFRMAGRPYYGDTIAVQDKRGYRYELPAESVQLVKKEETPCK